MPFIKLVAFIGDGDFYMAKVMLGRDATQALADLRVGEVTISIAMDVVFKIEGSVNSLAVIDVKVRVLVVKVIVIMENDLMDGSSGYFNEDASEIGISKNVANLLANFNETVSEVVRAKSGGKKVLAFTRIDGQNGAIMLAGHFFERVQPWPVDYLDCGFNFVRNKSD